MVSHPFRKEHEKGGVHGAIAVGAEPTLAAWLARVEWLARLEQPEWLAGLALLGLAAEPVQEHRLEPPEPQALREQALGALRLAPEALPQVERRRAEPGSAALPEFRAWAAWAVRRASPSACDSATPAYRSHPPARRRRSDRIWREFPDGPDRGLEWRAFHRPTARG